MKINLECGNDVIQGYKNLDENPINKLCEKGNFRNIAVADASADEIRVGNALCKIHMSEIPGIVAHWKSKLKVGGRLYVTGFDADLLCTAASYSQIGLDEFNRIMFGEPNSPHKGVYSIATMELFVQKNGFKIIEQGLNGNQFFIECEKV